MERKKKGKGKNGLGLCWRKMGVKRKRKKEEWARLSGLNRVWACGVKKKRKRENGVGF